MQENYCQNSKRWIPKIFVRDEHNPLYNSCIPHEVSPHIHFLAVGRGSRSLCEKVAKNENRKAKKCTAKIFSNKASISTAVGIYHRTSNEHSQNWKFERLSLGFVQNFAKKTPRKPYNHKGFSDFQKCSVIII